jgi:rSAM/selenodomain-associated transferase 2/rSAM/selenodomain-associated transferase 1
MRISIIIPAVNEESAIAATLSPLQALRAGDVELIVVDGGSFDATRERALPFADRVVASRRGRAAQMNAGAELATGDVLLFLHADTRLDPAGVAALRAAWPAAGRRWGRFDVAITGRSTLLPLVAAMMNLRSRLTGIATGDQGIFVDRRLFGAVGGFPDQPLMEDIEISRRLLRLAGRPLCLPRLLATSGRRWDRLGAARTIAQMWRLRYDYWRGADPRALAARYAPPAAAGAPTLQLFAKDPAPGFVKTRLARSIGAAAAADVYIELATCCFAAAAEARRRGAFGRVELWCTPAPLTPACRAWAQRYDFVLCEQREGDLGLRMQCAVDAALDRGERALVIGTDCPLLDADALCQAAAALRGHDAVLIPADDGGYVGIGLARRLPVFDDVAWSTKTVAATTRRRLAATGVRWRELPTLWDVDDVDDLRRWRAAAAAVPGPNTLAPAR